MEKTYKNKKEGTNPNIFKQKDMKETFKPVELEGEEYIVETDTVKVFTSLYLKSSYISDETFYLPERTVNYLIESGKLIGEEKDYWLEHTFKLEYLEDDDLSTYETPEKIEKAVEEKAEEFKVTGKTTIQELLDGGITEEKFEEVTGFKVPEDKLVLVRDFVIDKGI